MTGTEPNSYYNRVNPDLLTVIPVSARIVLEVGCGAGALGIEFLRRQPRARYYGVEMNEEAAVMAQSRLAGVARCDIEKEWNPHGLAVGSVDVLVFGDVLEHLRDPWDTLSRLAGLLREGGVVVACIPNVGHWSVVAGLLAGRFDYADEGLLDRTHLRFFTLPSILDLLRRAGVTPVGVRLRRLAGLNRGLEGFLGAAAPLSRYLGLPPNALEQNLSAFQYVVSAVKGAAPAGLALSQLIPGEGTVEACAAEPGRLLESLPGVTVRTFFKGVALQPAASPGAHVVLLHQPASIEPEFLIDCIARVIASGRVVVADWDDRPGHLPPMSPEAGSLLRACHAVQTGTEALAGALREFNPEVGVHASHLFVLPDAKPRSLSPVKLFFSASDRGNDWAPCVEALNRVLGSRPHAQVVVAHDRELFDQVGTGNKEFIPAPPRDRYLAELNGCHIAWLPLAEGVGNRCRSDVEAVEAGASALAILAQETVYAGSLRHGTTGWLYRDPRGFEAGLAALLDDDGLRARLGNGARAWVENERMAAYFIERRRDWYLDIWSRRDALTAALYQRVPELQERVAGLGRAL